MIYKVSVVHEGQTYLVELEFSFREDRLVITVLSFRKVSIFNT